MQSTIDQNKVRQRGCHLPLLAGTESGLTRTRLICTLKFAESVLRKLTTAKIQPGCMCMRCAKQCALCAAWLTVLILWWPQVVIFSKSYCPFCHKAKRAIGGVIDMKKVTVLEVRAEYKNLQVIHPAHERC